MQETAKTTTECIMPIMPPTLSKQVSLKSYALILGAKVVDSICPLNNLVAHEGNRKVPASTCIFNFGPASTCPSRRLGLCAAHKAGVKCYAQKTEYAYHPLVLPYRKRQEAFWQSITAEEFVAQFLLLNSMKVNPFKTIRFSEAGDFHNQSELDKAEKISQLLSRFGIKCYCYTSRSDLNFSKIKSLIVSGSGFTKPGISNIFKIIKNKKDKPKGWSMCKGNCRVCNYCQIRGKKVCVMAH